MFPTTCTTTGSLSEPTKAGQRHTVPSKSPSIGIMLATLGVNPVGHLGPNSYYSSPKVTNILPDKIKSPLHFYGTSALLPLSNLFIGHLLTPTTMNLPPCRQHLTTQFLIKILLMPLAKPDSPLLCHYFCCYLRWVFDNEMFTVGNTLTCSYGKLGEGISDLHSFRTIRG